MNKLTLLYVDTNSISLENLLMSSFLFEKDLQDLSRYKIIETKKEKAVSYIFKNRYIGEYQLNEFGKPICDKGHFNISHSKGVVVFIKDDIPIGVDIEKIRPAEEDLKNYISSLEEHSYIDSDKNFYEIWTNKEALTKCVGTGIKEKIKDIPSLPINGVKTYKNKTYQSKTIEYKGSIISIIRESNEPFEIEIKEERL